jgi:hypothetical protein
MNYLGSVSPESGLEVAGMYGDQSLMGVKDDAGRATDDLAVGVFFGLVEPNKRVRESDDDGWPHNIPRKTGLERLERSSHLSSRTVCAERRR